MLYPKTNRLISTKCSVNAKPGSVCCLIIKVLQSSFAFYETLELFAFYVYHIRRHDFKHISSIFAKLHTNAFQAILRMFSLLTVDLSSL